MPALRLSPRVFVHDAGSPAPEAPEQGTIVLSQIPSPAFGDGSHPTTRLCAGALDLLCRQSRPEAVLDVGTGTGVLARIARARGARFVAATDIDPRALAAARANCALDSWPGEIQIAALPPHSWGPRFQVVVANILEGPLRELAPSLRAAVAPGGVLLISGFTRLQVPALDAAFGLAREPEACLDGWAMLTFHPGRHLNL